MHMGKYRTVVRINRLPLPDRPQSTGGER